MLFNRVNVTSGVFYISPLRLLPWKTKYLMFFLFNSEPSAPPTNVAGQSISSTSISVTWDEVPAAEQNGIITNYNISYHSLTEKHSSSATMDYVARQMTLTGLREFVNYSITVFASTVVGNGPASDPIIVSTSEDSE